MAATYVLEFRVPMYPKADADQDSEAVPIGWELFGPLL